MSTIKSRNFIRGIFLSILLSPTLSFAATSNMGFDGLNTLIQGFAKGVVTSTGYLMFTLAVIAFFFGIVQFIWSARQGAEGKGIQRGTQFMKWGLIAIFVMFSVWGIIKFAQGVFGIQGDNTIIVPSLSFQQSGASEVRSAVTGVTGGVPPNSAEAILYNNCIKSGGGSNECNILSGRSTTNVGANAVVGTVKQQSGTQAGNSSGGGAGSPGTRSISQQSGQTASQQASSDNGSVGTSGTVIDTQEKANALAEQCAAVPGADPVACSDAAQAALENSIAGSSGAGATTADNTSTVDPVAVDQAAMDQINLDWQKAQQSADTGVTGTTDAPSGIGTDPTDSSQLQCADLCDY